MALREDQAGSSGRRQIVQANEIAMAFTNSRAHIGSRRSECSSTATTAGVVVALLLVEVPDVLGPSLHGLKPTGFTASSTYAASVGERGTRLFAEYNEIGESLGRIDQMGALLNDWDGYGSPAPSPLAMETARRVVEEFAVDWPERVFVAPCGGGGVSVAVTRGDDDVYIELHNTGDAMMTLARDGRAIESAPVRFDMNSLKSDIARIRSYLS